MPSNFYTLWISINVEEYLIAKKVVEGKFNGILFLKEKGY